MCKKCNKNNEPVIEDLLKSKKNLAIGINNQNSAITNKPTIATGNYINIANFNLNINANSKTNNAKPNTNAKYYYDTSDSEENYNTELNNNHERNEKVDVDNKMNKFKNKSKHTNIYFNRYEYAKADCN
jgi:hypothetical protein